MNMTILRSCKLHTNSYAAWRKCDKKKMWKIIQFFLSALRSMHLLVDFSFSPWWQEQKIKSSCFFFFIPLNDFFFFLFSWCAVPERVNTSRWCSLFLMFPSFDIRQETKWKIFLDSLVMRGMHKKTRCPKRIANYTNTSEQGEHYSW